MLGSMVTVLSDEGRILWTWMLAPPTARVAALARFACRSAGEEMMSVFPPGGEPLGNPWLAYTLLRS